MEGKEPTPVPYKMLLPLSTIFFIEAFVFSNIFSYIGFMVLDFHLTDDPDKVGYYAGYIGSTFSFAGFLSSFWWGRISDRYGRRPVLIFGCAGGMICTLIFGFSLSLEMAIAARFAAGILNGNVGVCKSYAADILDKTNQVKGVGVLQLGWGLGNVLGPLAGGILARPCTEYGICSTDSLLGKFPYLLPNVFSCFASIIAIVTLTMYLPKHEKNNKIIELKRIASNEFSIGDDDISINESGIVEEEDDDKSSSSSSASNATLQVKFSREDSKAGLLQVVEEEEEENSVKSRAGLRKRFSNWIDSKMEKDSIFSNKIAMLNIACYSLLASAFTMFDESFPLYAMSKKSDGGLSASSKDLGIIGSLNGIFTLIIQIFIFYPIASRLKFVRLYRLGLLIAFLLYFNYPTLNLASDNKPLLWTLITICTIAKVLAGQFTFTAVTALVSNSCKSTQVGAINGFAQSVVALFRAFSPAVAGNLIAWGFSNKLGFPLNQYLVFIIMSVLVGIAFLITFKFPASLDYPYEEPKGEKKEREEEKERMISNEEDERDTRERENE